MVDLRLRVYLLIDRATQSLFAVDSTTISRYPQISEWLIGSVSSSSVTIGHVNYDIVHYRLNGKLVDLKNLVENVFDLDVYLAFSLLANAFSSGFLSINKAEELQFWVPI